MFYLKGLTNVSSQAVGVEKRVKDLCKKANYTYCYIHDLSLVVVLTCKILVLDSVLNIVKEVLRLFVKVFIITSMCHRTWSGISQ